MNKFRMIFALPLTLSLFLGAEDSKPDGGITVEETFSREELGKPWHINFGEWRVTDGVMKIRQLKDDNHAAAARYPVLTEDAKYQIRFRLLGESQGFHFGFDPARGELDKKGHLFSVIVKPDSWLIMKHVDKNKPKEDPNEILKLAKAQFETGKWYQLTLTTKGREVTASIDGIGELAASHPTFGVKKPTVVLRVIGDGVEVDDLKVWNTVK